jgi:hypothetical protein
MGKLFTGLIFSLLTVASAGAQCTPGFDPLLGKITCPPAGARVSNAFASSTAAVTTLTVAVSPPAASLAAITTACFTGTTTLTPFTAYTIDSASTTSSVIFDFASTANIRCTVNATGAGPAGTPGSAGPQGPAGPGLVIDMASQAGIDSTGATDSAAGARAVVAGLGSTPAQLYWRTGTYKFSTCGATTESAVRISSALSMRGDGPANTIFTDVTSPTCGALFGFFWNPGTAPVDDYSWEQNTGYALTASTLAIGASSITLSTPSQASNFPTVGAFVYVRGSSIGTGMYHGELNKVAIAGNTGTGVVGLLWPLSSDFTGDTSPQLNVVTNAEVVQNISIQGIGWQHHGSSFVMAQQLNIDIFNNNFTFVGTGCSIETAQTNSMRGVHYHDNVVVNPCQTGVDAARNPTAWLIEKNTITAQVNVAEAGADVGVVDNDVACIINLPCIQTTITGTRIALNKVRYTYTGSGVAFAIGDNNGGGAGAINTTVTGNTITAANAPGGSVNVPGILLTQPTTVAHDNNINSDSTCIVVDGFGMQVAQNLCNLTNNLGFGGMLVESPGSHAVLINGFTMTASAGVTPPSCIWIANNGAQTAGTQASFDHVKCVASSNGFNIINGTNDKPIIGPSVFTGSTQIQPTAVTATVNGAVTAPGSPVGNCYKDNFTWGPCGSGGSGNASAYSGSFSSCTSCSITHNLGTLYPQCTIYDSNGCGIGSTGTGPGVGGSCVATTLTSFQGLTTSVWNFLLSSATSGHVTCSAVSAGSALSWAALTNSQWTGLTNGQWTGMTN